MVVVVVHSRQLKLFVDVRVANRREVEMFHALYPKHFSLFLSTNSPIPKDSSMMIVVEHNDVMVLVIRIDAVEQRAPEFDDESDDEDEDKDDWNVRMKCLRP